MRLKLLVSGGNYVLKLFSRATGEYALPFIKL